MKNAIRHTAIYLLTALVLVASTGFSVCCMFGCHDEKVASGVVDCCEKRIEESPVKDCPDCNSKYLSLDTDYVVNSPDFKVDLPQGVVFKPLSVFQKTVTPKKAIAPMENDLPPPAYGKELLSLIQSFLC